MSVGQALQAVCSEDFEEYLIPCCFGKTVPSLSMDKGAVVETFFENGVSTGISDAQHERSVKSLIIFELFFTWIEKNITESLDFLMYRIF